MSSRNGILRTVTERTIKESSYGIASTLWIVYLTHGSDVKQIKRLQLFSVRKDPFLVCHEHGESPWRCAEDRSRSAKAGFKPLRAAARKRRGSG